MEDGRAQMRPVAFCEALKKMFDEVLQNACDRSVANAKHVVVELGDARVAVANDGATIPIAVHPDWDGQYVAEGVFTRFGSGTNFDDSLERQGL